MSALTQPRLATRRSARGLLGTVLSLDAAWRSRRALGRLGADRLDDVGLSARDCRAHAESPAWNAPAHWLR